MPTLKIPSASNRQVFVNFTMAAPDLVDRVKESFARAGLHYVRADDLTTGGVYNKAVLRALEASGAMAVPVSGSPRAGDLSASTMFEIGAAAGARKPVYIVVDSPSYHVPFGVPGMRVLLANQVDEIGRNLLESRTPSNASRGRRARTAV